MSAGTKFKIDQVHFFLNDNFNKVFKSKVLFQNVTIGVDQKLTNFTKVFKKSEISYLTKNLFVKRLTRGN